MAAARAGGDRGGVARGGAGPDRDRRSRAATPAAAPTAVHSRARSRGSSNPLAAGSPCDSPRLRGGRRGTKRHAVTTLPRRREGVRVPDPSLPMPEGARAVQESEWNALLEPLRRFKGMSYNLRALLNGDCKQRYVDGGFSGAGVQERRQPGTVRTGVGTTRPARWPLRRPLPARWAASSGCASRRVAAADQPNNAHGHLVRTAVSMGAKVIEDQEETE